MKVRDKIFQASKIIIFLLCAHAALAQTKRPVQVNTVLLQPSPLYLNDYASDGLSKLQCALTFNDYNEPFWDVRLKLVISSSRIKLETKSNFLPSAPVTLTPGVPYTLTGSDFYEYFLQDNLLVSGSGAQLFRQTGRLPEGFYNFCVQVIDYASGSPLSDVSCGMGWLQLKEPPSLVFPQCDGLVKVSDPQSVRFQWQPVNSFGADQMDINYILTIHELTEEIPNPKAALANGQALQVFESLPLSQPFYDYSLADPVLEAGKQYLYQVQAVHVEGKDLFKNQGFTEPCPFYYGYPTNGIITLKEPENGARFSNNKMNMFQWTSPDKKLRNQPFEYKMTIVEIHEGQDSAQAIEENERYYTYATGKSFTTADFKKNIFPEEKKFDPGQKYAWMIKAFSDEQEVAQSEIRTFQGPPIVDHFYAGRYPIEIKSVTGGTLKDLSGTGLATIRGKEYLGAFRNVEIQQTESRYVLTKGVVMLSEVDLEPIALAPEVAANDSAYFYGEQIKLTTDDMYVYGQIKWPLAVPAANGERAFVTSKAQWFQFPKFELIGSATLTPNNAFDLLDPYGFKMEIDSASKFYVSSGTYQVLMSGVLHLPKKLNHKDQGGFQYAFKHAERLDYLDNATQISHPRIPVVDKTAAFLRSTDVIIDLSEAKSPGRKSQDASWKGIHFNKYDLILEPEVDEFKQLSLASAYSESIDATLSENDYAWIDGRGLTFYYDKAINSSTTLHSNSFPTQMTRLKISIDEDVVNDSYLKGSMIIPFINQQNPFGYVAPITISGFQTAYIEGLEGYEFMFSPDDENQKVRISFKRAEFKNKDHITSVVDLHWPVLNVKISSVAGFNIWGNKEIGFVQPNGTIKLNQHVNGKISSYAVTVDMVGAGRDQNFYSVGASFKIAMSQDISGIDGPPVTSFYSVEQNSLLSADYTPPSVPEEMGSWSADVGGAGAAPAEEPTVEDIAGKMEEEIRAQIYKNKLRQLTDIGNIGSLVYEEVEEENSGFTPATPQSDAGAYGDDDQNRGGVFAKLTPNQAALLEAIIEGFADEITRPVTSQIDTTSKRLAYKVDSVINVNLEKGLTYITGKVDTLVIALIMEAGGLVNLNGLDTDRIFNMLAQSTSNALNTELATALRLAVAEELTGPIREEIGMRLPMMINIAIREKTAELVIAAMEGDLSGSFIRDQIIRDLSVTAQQAGLQVFKNVISPKAIERRIVNTARSTVNNIDPQRILDNILEDFTAQMVNPENVAQMAVEMGMDKLSQSVTQEGTLANNLVNTAMAFTNLKERGVKGTLALAASNIKIKTKWLELSGKTEFIPDAPVYGDIWRADINLIIKKPKDIPLKGIYINGKTAAGVDYWFAQVAADDSEAKPGGDIRKAPKAVSKPIDLGFVNVVAASARVYKHMREKSGVSIVPDPSVKSGGYFRFVLFDKKKDGRQMRLNVEGELIAEDDSNMQLDFNGDIQVLSPSPRVFEPDPEAMANLMIMIHYNSREDHFLGQIMAKIQSKALCAEGLFEVETKPNYWHVYVGTYEDKIKITPACMAWGAVGYLMLDNRNLELGLGVSYMFAAGPVGLNLGIVKVGVSAYGYAAAGITAGLQYNPKVKILKAGLWLELYVKVTLDYTIKLALIKKSGSLTLVEIYALADLMMYFDPPPTLMEGNVKGKVAVLNGLIKCSFNAGFKTTL